MSEFGKYLGLARDYSNKQNHEKSIECWNKVVKLNSNYSTGWILMGEEYEKLQNYDKALECYEYALKINSQDEDALWRKSELLRKTSDIDVEHLSSDQQVKLSQIYDKMTDIHPTPVPGLAIQIAFPESNADVSTIKEELYKKGILEFAQKKYEKAIKYWKEFSQKKPNSFEVWSSLGRAYMSIGNYTEAIASINKSLEINPSNPIDWENLGSAVILDANERYGDDYVLENVMSKSIEYYEKALKCSVKRYDLLLKIGIQYASIGSFKKAIDYMNKYLDQIPDDIQALKHLEQMQLQAEFFSKCRICRVQNDIGITECTNCGANLIADMFYSKILDVPFSSKEASKIFDKGMEFIKSNKLQNAIKSFKKVLSKEPNHITTLEKLGFIYTIIQPSEAIKMFEKIYSINPNSMIALDNLSNLYSKIHDQVKLHDCIDKIKEAGETYFKYLIQVGEQFSKRGDLNNAVRYWAKILALDPEYKDAIYKLETISKHQNYKRKVEPHIQKTIVELLSKSFTYILKLYNVDVDEINAIREKQKKTYPGSATGGILKNKEIIKLFNKAGQLKQSQKYAEAIKILLNALKIDSHVPVVYEQLGINHHLKKDRSNAIKYLEKSIELNPYQVLAWETLASIYHNQGNVAKADQIFKNLISFGPMYANYMVDSGKLAFRNRIIQSAAVCWQKALMADPNNKEAKVYLTMLQQKFSKG